MCASVSCYLSPATAVKGFFLLQFSLCHSLLLQGRPCTEVGAVRVSPFFTSSHRAHCWWRRLLGHEVPWGTRVPNSKCASKKQLSVSACSQCQPKAVCETHVILISGMEEVGLRTTPCATISTAPPGPASDSQRASFTINSARMVIQFLMKCRRRPLAARGSP